jgi:diguanylate cyclase (GGDEF)-like protein
MDAERFPIGSRAHVDDGVGGRAVTEEGLVVAQRGDCDAAAVAGLVCRSLEWAMAAPIFENGRVVGALSAGSRDPDRAYSAAEEKVLLAFAEHASLALTDAKNFGTALHRALHDMLTGLPNRALFMDRLRRAILRTKRQEHYRFAVLFLDLDGFKVVNDGLGHRAGDELLQAVANRLLAVVRPNDTVARLGGDEFVVVCENLLSENHAILLADRIAEVLATPVTVSGRDVTITASIGVVVTDAGHIGAEELLRDADVAMYQAKERGRARFAVRSVAPAT